MKFKRQFETPAGLKEGNIVISTAGAEPGIKVIHRGRQLAGNARATAVSAVGLERGWCDRGFLSISRCVLILLAISGLGVAVWRDPWGEYDADQGTRIAAADNRPMEWKPISTAPFDRDLELAMVD